MLLLFIGILKLEAPLRFLSKIEFELIFTESYDISNDSNEEIMLSYD
jgi:hypothetical protein